MNLLSPAAESLTLTSREFVENPAGVAAVVNVVENWHNEKHAGAFRNCQLQPCYGVLRVTDGPVE